MWLNFQIEFLLLRQKQALHDLGKFVSFLETELYDLFVVGLQEVPNSDAEKLLISSFGQGHRCSIHSFLLHRFFLCFAICLVVVMYFK
jgi:hypothetical protein